MKILNLECAIMLLTFMTCVCVCVNQQTNYTGKMLGIEGI